MPAGRSRARTQRQRRQHLGAHRGRERRELVGELARAGGVAGRQPHLDSGREEPGPRRPGPVLVEHPPSGAHRAVDVALRQPQQREAGDGVVPVPARLAVRVGGGIQLAAQAVQLAPLVVGEAERGVEGVGQSLARQVGFGRPHRPTTPARGAPVTGGPCTGRDRGRGRAGRRTSAAAPRSTRPHAVGRTPRRNRRPPRSR